MPDPFAPPPRVVPNRFPSIPWTSGVSTGVAPSVPSNITKVWNVCAPETIEVRAINRIDNGVFHWLIGIIESLHRCEFQTGQAALQRGGADIIPSTRASVNLKSSPEKLSRGLLCS